MDQKPVAQILDREGHFLPFLQVRSSNCGSVKCCSDRGAVGIDVRQINVVPDHRVFGRRFKKRLDGDGFEGRHNPKSLKFRDSRKFKETRLCMLDPDGGNALLGQQVDPLDGERVGAVYRGDADSGAAASPPIGGGTGCHGRTSGTMKTTCLPSSKAALDCRLLKISRGNNINILCWLK